MNGILIRQKARELRAKARRQMLGTLAVPVVVAFFYALCIKQFPSLRGGLHALFALALAWSITGLYVLNRGRWSREMPGDAGSSTGVEFCLRETERLLDYFHGVLFWSLGPVLLAIGAFIVAIAVATGVETFSKAIPFLALVVVWLLAYLWIRAQQQRKLLREFHELREIESEGRADRG